MKDPWDTFYLAMLRRIPSSCIGENGNLEVGEISMRVDSEVIGD
jgi:hypothetical protein